MATTPTFGNTDMYVKRTELEVLGDNSVTILNLATGGSIGTAPNTVDAYSIINVNQTTASQTITVPSPTNTALDKVIMLNNIGTTAFTAFSTVLQPNSGVTLTWTGSAYAVAGTSSGATNVTVAGGKTFTVSNTLTLAGVDGKIETFNNSITWAGTDGTTMTFPTTSATIARTDAGQTFTGVQTFTSTPVFTHITAEGVTSTGATGTGNLVFATTPTLTTPVIGAATGTSLVVTGAVTSNGTAGIGYATGAGGAVTQLTNRSTGVTLSKISGTITTNNTSLAAETGATFVVTNTLVAITDVVVVSMQSGSNGGNTTIQVVTTTNGSFSITVANQNASGGTAETGAILINFAILKSVAA